MDTGGFEHGIGVYRARLEQCFRQIMGTRAFGNLQAAVLQRSHRRMALQFALERICRLGVNMTEGAQAYDNIGKS